MMEPAGASPYAIWMRSDSGQPIDPGEAKRRWEAAVAYIEAGAPATLATVNRDGRPQLSLVWVGVEGDQLVIAHLKEHLKVRNMRRDPRVAVSFASGSKDAMGIQEYLVIEGTGEVSAGGAHKLVARLSKFYMEPEHQYEPGEVCDEGWVTRVTINRVRGWGPWHVG